MAVASDHGDDRRDLRSRAWSLVDAESAGLLLERMVDIPSPTGHESHLAEYLAGHLAGGGVDVQIQRFGADQANVVGTYGEDSGGPRLLVYAPIDSAWSGVSNELPMLGDEPSAAFQPRASRLDGQIVGIGAENPKSFAACVVVAAEAIARAKVRLEGQLVVGLGAGGMPTGPPPDTPSATGHGVGCERLLEMIRRPDFAVIAKPGFDVAYEEVGLCWFRVRVRGTLGYTGVRHIIPYKNPIVDAAKLVGELERWFPTYTAAHSSGTVAPQGAVGSITGGWPDKPAFTPASCDLLVDLRVSPRTSIEQVEAEFSEVMASIASKTNVDATWETILAIPGSRTSPDDWIIRSSITAWETVTGEQHEFRSGTSGSTDANIIRARGIPTGRIGMPRVAPPEGISGFTMGTADPAAMVALVRCLCAVVIDTCTRDHHEVGVSRA